MAKQQMHLEDTVIPSQNISSVNVLFPQDGSITVSLHITQSTQLRGLIQVFDHFLYVYNFLL